jgi:hypothetical protein
MTHEPYENWLFEKDLLSREQARELEEHIKNCPECQQKVLSWQRVQAIIETMPPVNPKPGFTQRWRASIEERMMREQLRQTRKFFLILAGASVVILWLLVIKVIATTTPADFVVSAFQALTSLLVAGVHLRDLLMEWLPSVPLAVPLIAWIVVTLAFGSFIVYWGISVWRMINKGAASK